jgi:hypothetical protein
MTSAAETLGMAAFASGLPAVPGADQHLMAEVAKVGGLSKAACSMMRAWLRGWHKANLAATL